MTFKVTGEIMIYAAGILISASNHGLLTVWAGVGNSTRTTVPIESSHKFSLSIGTE